jgi:hypothetical protein
MKIYGLGTRLALISTVALALGSISPLGAAELTLTRNALPFGESGNALVTATEPSSQGTLQVFVGTSGSLTSPRFDPNGSWKTLASGALTAQQGSIAYDSLSIGPGKVAVRAATTASDATPGFDLTVSTTQCLSNFEVQIVSASGPGIVQPGEGGLWEATISIKACQALGGVSFTPATSESGPALKNAIISQQGRSIKAVRIGNMAAGETRTFTIGISGTLPADARRNFDINKMWSVSYTFGKTKIVDWVREPLTVELQ